MDLLEGTLRLEAHVTGPATKAVSGCRGGIPVVGCDTRRCPSTESCIAHLLLTGSQVSEHIVSFARSAASFYQMRPEPGTAAGGGFVHVP